MLRAIIIFAAAAGLVVVDQATPAEACGVKLTVKAPRVKKRVPRSANPSRILLLGRPPSKLASRLSEAGHRVDVAKSSDQARSKRYALVVADPDKVDEARRTYPNTRVVTRSSSMRSNLKKVEQSLASAPPSDSGTRVAERPSQSSRQARRARPASRPATTNKVGREPEQPTRVAAAEPGTDDVAEEPRRPDVEAEPEPEPPAVTVSFTEEFFFGTNASRLTGQQRTELADDVKWLRANPSMSITIEGHTDSAGSAAYNMKLSRRRAQTVRAYLIRRGISRRRIEIAPYGEERPAYTDDDAKNRRVFIVRN